MNYKRKIFNPVKTKAMSMLNKIIIYVILIIASLIVLIPFYWVFISSLKSFGEVFLYPPSFIPEKLYFQNYIETWNSSNFARFFLNSLIVTVSAVTGQVLTSSLAAFSFSRLDYKGRDKIFFLYLGTLMIPAQLLIIPNFIIMRSFNLINTYWGLILPSMFTALGTFLLRQFFLTIPKELDEAALIDGASYFRIYWNIIMPLAKPGLAAVTVLSFLNVWNNFLWPLIIVNEDKMRTLPIGLSNFIGMYRAEWNLVMCATIITMAPVLILYLFAQRYFIEGVALTGIKD